MPIPVLYNGIVNDFQCGVRERWHAGRHEAQAWAAVYDGSELASPVYGLVPEADRQFLNPLDTSTPFPTRELSVEAIEARIGRVATARALMTEQERSPLDLIHIAHQLSLDATRLEREWQAERDALAEQTRQDQEDMALAGRVQRGLQLLAAAQAQAQKEKQDNGSK